MINGGYMTDIFFNFITEAEGVNLSELAVTAYNLALCYFYWDIFKFIFELLKFTFRRYHK